MAETDPKRSSASEAIARMALRRGASFARKRIDKRLAATGFSTRNLERIAKGEASFASRLAAAVLIRLATRSVPGALAVGGGLVAKALIQRRRRRKAAATVEDPAG